MQHVLKFVLGLLRDARTSPSERQPLGKESLIRVSFWVSAGKTHVHGGRAWFLPPAPTIAKSSSKQITCEDWGTCKKEKVASCPLGAHLLSCRNLGPPGATSRAKHGGEHSGGLRTWWVAFSVFSLHCGEGGGSLAGGDLISNTGACSWPRDFSPARVVEDYRV